MLKLYRQSKTTFLPIFAFFFIPTKLKYYTHYKPSAYDIMPGLHKSSKKNKSFVPRAEQSGLLCSNKTSSDCSALDIIEEEAKKKILIDEFASIIVEMFMEAEGHNVNVEECNNVLPGINERTS